MAFCPMVQATAAQAHQYLRAICPHHHSCTATAAPLPAATAAQSPNTEAKVKQIACFPGGILVQCLKSLDRFAHWKAGKGDDIRLAWLHSIATRQTTGSLRPESGIHGLNRQMSSEYEVS